jgi:DNA-binding transcriptional regulator YdaS (Cro superfamily)
MARKLLFLVLALASCSKGPEADLQYISGARSVAAEWALVNEQANKGHLTDAYVRTMHKAVRQQLQTNSKSLTGTDSAYAREISALLREPDDAPPAELRAHASKLRQIEDRLESA